ncbi:MAG: ATP synthase F1 subunit epsilon [Candidatus Caldarchaeum sp.]
MTGKIALEIVTPERLVLRADVDEVTVPGQLGEFGILPGHTPIISLMNPGVVRYVQAGKEERLIVWGGIADAREDKVKIITVGAESPQDIDREEARVELERVMEKLKAFSGSDEEFKQLDAMRKLAELRAGAIS